MAAQDVPPHVLPPRAPSPRPDPPPVVAGAVVGVRSSHTTMDRIFVAIIISALLLLLGVPGLILVRQAEMHHARTADMEEQK
jgi:hypothetical protein